MAVKNENNKKIGIVIRRALGHDIPVSVEKKQGFISLFMSEQRRHLLHYLCMFPATSLRHISRDLHLSLPSVRWHLKLLHEAGVVSVVNIGKFRVAFPEMLIDPQDAGAYALLNTENGWIIFNHLLSSPGISHSRLMKETGMSTQNLSVWMGKFTREGLIAVVKDGRRNRYFPTVLLMEIEKRERARRNRFKKHILNKLNLDGVSPEVLESTGKRYTLRLHVAEESYTLRLHLTPLKTIVEGRDAFFREMEAMRVLPKTDGGDRALSHPIQAVAGKIGPSLSPPADTPSLKGRIKTPASEEGKQGLAQMDGVNKMSASPEEDGGTKEGLVRKLKKAMSTDEEREDTAGEEIEKNGSGNRKD